MKGRKQVPVFDYTSQHRLYHVTVEEALEMLERKDAFQKTPDPLELRLTEPSRRAMEGLLRPDRSLTVSPTVIRGAADGISSCVEIVNSYKPRKSSTQNAEEL